ncbi:MAG: helix-hairpin-helix domain-containing protein [Spirochaetales bacterium]|nr:helix-hairpin-helix domain-containing protein [Spirochaetales bacterium]
MPGILIKPNIEKKLDILAASAQHDVCLASCNSNPSGGRGRIRHPAAPESRWIYPAHIPGKGMVHILKVLQTNLCENKCSYCSIAANRDSSTRTGFGPEELARAFMKLVECRLVHGIFISSGMGLNFESVMDRIIQTAEILRLRYHFDGYIHLKILPGVSLAHIERAAALADRISINCEAPTREHLDKIAPNKRLAQDIITRMKWAGSIIQHGARAKSQTTQFVVGAGNETDLEILKTVDWIYRELFVYRSYFSAYQSEQAKNTFGLLREHRLYQTDFLLRGYGFRLGDLVFDSDGKLPLSVDPKQAYARMHPELYPVDINKASLDLLLKVPGIGPVSAYRIMTLRKEQAFTCVEDLKETGAIVSRAGPYIEFSGRKDRMSYYIQGYLFEQDPEKGWQTGCEPYQAYKINKADTLYDYPGQKGKPLNYCEKGKPVYCK